MAISCAKNPASQLKRVGPYRSGGVMLPPYHMPAAAVKDATKKGQMLEERRASTFPAAAAEKRLAPGEDAACQAPAASSTKPAAAWCPTSTPY